MQDNLLVLLLVQRHRLVNFATLLDKDLVNFQFDGLTLNDFLFNSVLGHKPVDIDILALSNSMRSIHRLQVNLRVEVGVKEHDVVGRHQVYSQATSSR